MTKKKVSKRNPRSEAAMREAIKIGEALVWRILSHDSDKAFLQACSYNGEIVAIFDLRDCYRKRAPLKGVAKELKKVMTKRRR